MTSLLQDKLYEIHSQAPSPSKDFHHFTITKTEVIWRSWRISFRPSQEKIFPKEVRKCHSDFLLNEQLHKEVQNIFGSKMLEYTLNLCQGRYDFLVRMPDKVLMHILSFLNADDIRQLSNTCKKFQQYLNPFEDLRSLITAKLCSNEEFWEQVRLLQDEHTHDVKIMGFPTYKKLTNFNQKLGHQKQVQRREPTFF